MFGNGCFLLAGSRSWKNISDVAGMAGFEPTISESKSGVLPLHYIPISGQKSSGIGITPNPRFRGVGKGVRTLDTRNHNPVLSRLSYTHHRSEMVRQEGFEPLLPQKFFYVISNTNLKFFHRRWKGVLIDLFNHVSR